MTKIEAVLFDCDGVVVNSDNLQRQAEQATAPGFAEQYDLPFAPDDVDWDAMQGWARTKIAANIFGVDVGSELADQFRLAVVEKTVEIATAENTPLIEGITPFVQYMVLRGAKVGLATSSHRRIYSQYCALNAMDFFPPQYVVTHGECKENKPKPGPYLEVMRRMDVAPENTLVVEDSRSGIEAGRYAGATVLAITTTKSYDYLQTSTGAHIVAEDFREAANLLQDRLPAS